MSKPSQQVKWQMIAVFMTACTLALAFQNCGPTMSPEKCSGPDCKDSKTSASTTPATLGEGGTNYFNSGTGTSTAVLPGGTSSTGGSTGTGTIGTPTTGTGSTSGTGTFTGGGSSALPGTSTSPGVVGLSFAFHPRDTKTEEGAYVILSAYAMSGSGTVNYQWYKDGQMLAGLTASTIEIRSATRANEGSFHVVASDGVNPPLSSLSARVTVVAGRNPCLTQDYSPNVATMNATEFIPSVMAGQIGLVYRMRLNELADSYIVVSQQACTFLNPGFGLVVGGSVTLQCRNGRYAIVQNGCYSETPGGS